MTLYLLQSLSYHYYREIDHHEKALKVMFHDFTTKKGSRLPALKEIHLSCSISPSEDDAYKEESRKLVAEAEEGGCCYT